FPYSSVRRLTLGRSCSRLIIHGSAALAQRSDDGLDRQMLRMLLILVERGAIPELRAEHDVPRSAVYADIDADFVLQHSGNGIAASLQRSPHFLDAFPLGCAVAFQLPHHDV